MRQINSFQEKDNFRAEERHQTSSDESDNENEMEFSEIVNETQAGNGDHSVGSKIIS